MSEKITITSIGSDPEAFLQDKTTGKFISAIGIIPGNKYNPFPVSEEGHAIQVDNVAVEVCIPPALNPDKTFNDICFSFDKIEKIISKKNLKIALLPSAEFEADQLQSEEANEFGCQPDIDCYTMQENPKPVVNSGFRSCGGHVHIGMEEPNMQKSATFAQILDLFLAVPGVIKDTDTKRRQLYGKAGAIRIKDYGFEFRTLSNFWLKDRESVRWLYRNIFAAVDFANSNYIIDEEEKQEIIDCINTGNQEKAKEICNKYKIEI